MPRDFISQSFGELHLYADGTSGDDANDGLSVASPKATLQAVFDLVPDQINHNTCIHLAGTFDISSATSLVVNFNRSLLNGILLIDGGATFYVLDDNTGSNYTADADKHGTYFLGDDAASWTVDEWMGYTVEIMSGALAGQYRTIKSNTANTIYVTYPFTSSGAVTDPGEIEFRVVRYDTTIKANGPAHTNFVLSFNSPAGQYANVDIGLQRINFEGNKLTNQIYSRNTVANSCLYNTTAPGGAYGALWTELGTPTTLCRYDPATFTSYTDNVPSLAVPQGRWTSKSNDAAIDYIVAKGLYIEDSTIAWVRGCRLEYLNLRGTVTWEGAYGLAGMDHGRALVISNPSGVGISIKSCAMQTIAAWHEIAISNCSSHGIEVVNSKFDIAGVITGSGNGGAGVYAHSNSVVHIKDGSPPTLTGTVGDLSTDGTTESMSWPALDGGSQFVDVNEQVTAKEVA